MLIENIANAVQDLRGCLKHQRTETSHRRRDKDEDPLKIAPFVSDTMKLGSSKVTRTLAHKTQVFTFPWSPLMRTRQTHTQETEDTAAGIADFLGLNHDLARAIGRGHDIGHVPFGHDGERWFQKKMNPKFCHEVMGVVIAQKVERKGLGLNLTWHTLDGMQRHSGDRVTETMSPEAWVVRYADKFAYLFHDINDITIRMKYPVPQALKTLVEEFGPNQRVRENALICGLVMESAEKERVSFEDSPLAQKFKELRGLMYEIYPKVTQPNIDEIMGQTHQFLERLDLGDPFLMMALMIDKDIKNIAAAPVKDMYLLNQTAISELIEHLPNIGKPDLCDPDLNW